MLNNNPQSFIKILQSAKKKLGQTDKQGET